MIAPNYVFDPGQLLAQQAAGTVSAQQDLATGAFVFEITSPQGIIGVPSGPILGWVSEQGLQRLVLPQEGAVVTGALELTENSLTQALTRALERYFSGALERFSAIPLDLSSGTEFQQQVWEEACNTSWGETSSYGELALRIGKTAKASRAVGQALGANPVPIVVPCHRFLAANGKLGGFSAGLAWKQALLKIEDADIG